jgi:hypothetical protein
LPAFWSAYRNLPESVRALADNNFALLKSDPRHYRALAVEVENGLLWFWIGSYADYDATLK